MKKILLSICIVLLALSSYAMVMMPVTGGSGGSGGAAGSPPARLSGDEEYTDTSSPISQSLTVPTGTDIAVVGLCGSFSTANVIDSASPTLGLNAPDGEIVYDEDIYETSCAIFWWLSGSQLPGTGSQTFAITISGLDAGIQFYASYYENVSTVRDSDVDHNTGDNASGDITLTTVSGDMVFGIGGSTDYNQPEIVNENSQTEIADRTHDSDTDGSYMSSGTAQISATGSSQTFTGTGDNITVCAISMY